MMSARPTGAQRLKQTGAAVLFVVAVIIFAFSFAIGESRAQRRAARVNTLSESRIALMHERLGVCKEEQTALRKGKATSESTAGTLKRSREILLKEVAMLQDTIKMDRQAVNDCVEEADAERRARTGTTDRDANKALAELRAQRAKIEGLIEDIRAAGGAVISSSSASSSSSAAAASSTSRRMLKRLTRAYALENKALSLKLYAMMRPEEEATAAPEQQPQQQQQVSQESDDTSNKNPPAKATTKAPAPTDGVRPAMSKEELRALLMGNARRQIARRQGLKRAAAARYHAGRLNSSTASTANADAADAAVDAAADEEEDEILYAVFLARGGADSGKGKQPSSDAMGPKVPSPTPPPGGKAGAAVSSRKSDFDALVEDMEEGLQMIDNAVALPDEALRRSREERDAARLQRRKREAQLRMGRGGVSGGLQPRRRRRNRNRSGAVRADVEVEADRQAGRAEGGEEVPAAKRTIPTTAIPTTVEGAGLPVKATAEEELPKLKKVVPTAAAAEEVVPTTAATVEEEGVATKPKKVVATAEEEVPVAKPKKIIVTTAAEEVPVKKAIPTAVVAAADPTAPEAEAPAVKHKKADPAVEEEAPAKKASPVVAATAAVEEEALATKPKRADPIVTVAAEEERLTVRSKKVDPATADGIPAKKAVPTVAAVAAEEEETIATKPKKKAAVTTAAEEEVPVSKKAITADAAVAAEQEVPTTKPKKADLAAADEEKVPSKKKVIPTTAAEEDAAAPPKKRASPSV